MKDFIEEKLRAEIENVLTPPAPKNAEHGGVKNWEYYYNKEGMKFMVDRIMELFEEQKAEILKRLPDCEACSVKEIRYKGELVLVPHNPISKQHFFEDKNKGRIINQ